MGTGTSRFRALVRDADGKRRAWAAPVPWIVGTSAAAAIGIAGLFGGLAPVQETVLEGDEKTVVDAGVATIGVEKALIFDEAEALNVTLTPDEDLLLLRVRVTSTFDEPVFANSLFATTIQLDTPGGVDAEPAKNQILRVPELSTSPILLQRLDTTETSSVVLQPNVPTTLAVGFVIPRADNDLTEIHLQIDKITTFQFTFLGDGEDHGYNSEGRVAMLTLPVIYDELTP